MPNLTGVIQQLKKERERAQRELGQLDAALKVLGGLRTFGRSFGRAQTIARKRKPMSAAARKRIAAAQRARWAKWRAAKPHK